MNTNHTLHHPKIHWDLNHPRNGKDSALVIILPDWVYGLLPFCGPGSRRDAWIREIRFQEEVCKFLNAHEISTLTLMPTTETEEIPTDNDIISASYIPDVYTTIKELTKESGYNLNRSAIFGHGFGVRMMCGLVEYGLKPAGYIIASGIYSDIDSIISQKYLPFKEMNLECSGIEKIPPIDSDTILILQNLGKILHASRKGREIVRFKEWDQLMEIHLPRELFANESSPAVLLSALDAPSLILHGSGDLDIPVSNAFFLETKLKQKINSVSRIVILDRDHWFREMPNESQDRISERLSGACIHNPIDNRFLKNCLVFIEDLLKIKRRKNNSTELVNKQEINLYPGELVLKTE